MANEDSGPSRSHTYRTRSRSPENERRSRPRDRRSPSRGARDERREGTRRSRSRDRRGGQLHDDRNHQRSSRGREPAYDERQERNRHPGRHASASRSPPRRRRRSASPSSSSSSSSASSEDESKSRKKSKKSNRRRDSSTSTDDRRETRKHSSKSKDKRSHKSRHRSSSDDTSDEHARKKQARAEKKERKRKKKEKKKQKKEQSSKHKSAISEYGKYGIITEADMFTKDQEFRAWIVEEKMLNPETIPQMKMKELFKVYMEDFNTATLPHEKYYALEKYEARMDAIRSGNVTTQSDTYDPRADEAALAAQHKRVAKTDGEVYIGRAQLEQLRRIERERVEASRMKRMGMEVKESMGVRYEAD